MPLAKEWDGVITERFTTTRQRIAMLVSVALLLTPLIIVLVIL